MALTWCFFYVIIYVVINQKEDSDPAQKKFVRTFVLLPGFASSAISGMYVYKKFSPELQFSRKSKIFLNF